MTPAGREDALVEELGFLGDPREVLALVVDRGTRLPAVPAERRLPDLRVKGCISGVWLEGGFEEGRCRWRVAADSPMVSALVALLVELYDEATPAEVIAHEPGLWTRLGLDRALTPTRLQGLAAVRARLEAMARGWADGSLPAR